MNGAEKRSNTQLGRVVIHKGDIEKRIYKIELDKYLADGWTRGISDNHRKTLSLSKVGNIPWNKGTQGLMKPNKSSFKKGQTAWNRGVKGVYTAWNKGKTKETDYRVENLSKSLVSTWNNNPERRKQASERMSRTARRGKLPPDVLENFLTKSYETKKKHNSFNKSKLEELYYQQLCAIYGDNNIKRQYRDKVRYPFRCDFYVVSEDLFIECNFHWTHGGMPFNPEEPKCIEQLNEWKEKAKESEYFRIAIDTWTCRDVKKLKIAIKNKLNYKVIY